LTGWILRDNNRKPHKPLLASAWRYLQNNRNEAEPTAFMDDLREKLGYRDKRPA
jgi:hypothetical protein